MCVCVWDAMHYLQSCKLKLDGLFGNRPIKRRMCGKVAFVSVKHSSMTF